MVQFVHGPPELEKNFCGKKRKTRGHEGTGTKIGVFLCGPPQIGAQLEANSRKFSDPPNVLNGTKFVPHQEIF